MPPIPDSLGLHIANANQARKTLTNSVQLSRRATTIISEAIQHAEAAEQTLHQIDAGLQAIIKHAENIGNGVMTTAGLRRVLRDYLHKLEGVERDHQRHVDNAWEAWRDAVDGMVKAGDALKQHDSVVSALEEDMRTNVFEEGNKYSLAVRSGLRRQGEDLDGLLEEAKTDLQEALAKTPRALNGRGKAWKSVHDSVVETFSEAEGSIETAERGRSVGTIK